MYAVQPTKISHRRSRSVAIVLATAATAGSIAAAPAIATASRTTSSAHPAAIRPAKSTVCSKVSAGQISAIVGFTVPALDTSFGTSGTIPASAKNDGITGTYITCYFGKLTSASSITKTVVLESFTFSRALTPAEFQKVYTATSKEGSGFKISPYSGLGGVGFQFSESSSAFFFRGIFTYVGTHGFGAAVFSKSISTAKVASLAKLASQL